MRLFNDSREASLPSEAIGSGYYRPHWEAFHWVVIIKSIVRSETTNLPFLLQFMSISRDVAHNVLGIIGSFSPPMLDSIGKHTIPNVANLMDTHYMETSRFEPTRNDGDLGSFLGICINA